MENKQMKCVKMESCLHCGSNYCRFVDELDQLKKTLTEIKEIAEKQVKRAPDGETFARPEIKQILQKISEVENDNRN